MELQRCRLCGDRHRLGPCPKFQSSRGGGDRADPGSTPSGLQQGADTSSKPKQRGANTRRPVGAGNVAKPPLPPRETVTSSRGEARKKREQPAAPPSGAKRSAKAKKAKATASASSRGTKVKKGRPFKGEEAKTLAALAPWTAAGVSKATWYRNKARKK